MFGFRDQIKFLKIGDLTRETNRAVKGIGAVPGGPCHLHKYSKYLEQQVFVPFQTHSNTSNCSREKKSLAKKSDMITPTKVWSKLEI